jgi:hypothetical protein
MARCMAVALAGAVVLAGGAARTADAPARSAKGHRLMLAFLHGPDSATLVRLEPASLRPLAGRRLNVGLDLAWSFSPDRSLLALGGEFPGPYVPSLRVVAVARMEQLGPRFQLAPAGWVVATGWIGRDRLVALVSHTDTMLVTVDAAQRKVVARQHFEGQWQHVQHTPDGFVVLIAPEGKIGPPRLAVLRPSGAVDVTVLDRVLAGNERTKANEDAEFRQRKPALTVDSEHGRAYVVQVGGPVAEVDLATLGVSYHALSQRRSLLARLARWLQPAAHAKRIEGPVRHARWVGDGLIVISGGDYSVTGSARGAHRDVFTPSGVELIDTRDWSIRTIVRGADSFRVAGDVVLATSSAWSSELTQPAPIGLAAYGLDGRERFRMYNGRRAYVIYADARRAYVDPQGPGMIDVIEVTSGRLIEKRTSMARPLAGDAWNPSG